MKEDSVITECVPPLRLGVMTRNKTNLTMNSLRKYGTPYAFRCISRRIFVSTLDVSLVEEHTSASLVVGYLLAAYHAV